MSAVLVALLALLAVELIEIRRKIMNVTQIAAQIASLTTSLQGYASQIATLQAQASSEDLSPISNALSALTTQVDAIGTALNPSLTPSAPAAPAAPATPSAPAAS